jgi:hypothetical protein
VNTYGFTEWSTTYNSHVVLVQSLNQQLSMKIILLAFVQKKEGYIKGNIAKYITPKPFYGKIETLQIKS